MVQYTIPHKEEAQMKMKRFLVLSLVIIAVILLFSGCSDVAIDIITLPLHGPIYRSYYVFALMDGGGCSKEEAIEKVGLPDIAYDTEGKHYCQWTGCPSGHSFTDAEFKEILLRNDVVLWHTEYTNEYGPYFFRIKFNEDGKVIEAIFELAPGG